MKLDVNLKVIDKKVDEIFELIKDSIIKNQSKHYNIGFNDIGKILRKDYPVDYVDNKRTNIRNALLTNIS